MQEFWKKLGLRDKERRRIWQLGGLLVLGMALMGISTGFSEPLSGEVMPAMADADIEETEPGQTFLSPEEELERKLAAILSRIEGAGEVNVSLTFARSAQTEYAVNASTTLRSTQEAGDSGQMRSTTEQTSTGELVMSDSSGKSKPVAVQESMAQVQGVLVVAEGADKPQVCAQISEALQNLLALPAHKIVICRAG